MTERLLVVDDSDTVRGAYEAHFSSSGFEVQAAASLEEAAKRLDGPRFGAVIVDVSLSSEAGAEGLAIAAYLRQTLRPRPPVIVLTAYGEPQRAAAAARLGVDAFLHKPVSLVWLERLLRSRMNGHNGSHDPRAATAAP